MSGVVPGTDNPRGDAAFVAAVAEDPEFAAAVRRFVVAMGAAFRELSDEHRERMAAFGRAIQPASPALPEGTGWRVELARAMEAQLRRYDGKWRIADVVEFVQDYEAAALPEGTGAFQTGRKAGLEEAAGIAAALSRSPMSDEPWRSIRDAARSVAALPEGRADGATLCGMCGGRGDCRFCDNPPTAPVVAVPEAGERPPCRDHKPVQHRDRQPPWCRTCGWTDAKPAVPARQIAAPVVGEREEKP